MWDLQISKPEIIQQVSWEQKSPQEVLNSVVEQQRQTIIEWMKRDILRDWISPKRVEELQYDVIWNIWVIVSRGKLAYLYKYSKENWVEFYTTFPWLQKDDDLPFALKETWYELKDWKLFIWWKEIPQFLWNSQINPVFVKWIDDINFYANIQWIFWMVKVIQKWKKLEEFSISYFEKTIIWWLSRIKDVMYFAWKWYIPQKKDVLRLLKRAVQELPNQCSDMRFVRNPKWQDVWMEVTKQELDEYLHPTEWAPLITQKVYNDCLKRIEARDRKIQEEQRLKEWTRSEIKIEKERKWFADKAMEIIRWIF